MLLLQVLPKKMTEEGEHGPVCAAATDPVSAEVPDAAGEGGVPALADGHVADAPQELRGQARRAWGADKCFVTRCNKLNEKTRFFIKGTGET